MGTNGGTVDECLAWRSSGVGKSYEDVAPDTFFSPPNKAVVERLSRSIFCRRINPATAGSEDVYNSRDDAAIIDTCNAANLVGQKRFQASELIFRQPKQVIGHTKLPSGAMNHRLRCFPRAEIGPERTFTGMKFIHKADLPKYNE